MKFCMKCALREKQRGWYPPPKLKGLPFRLSTLLFSPTRLEFPDTRAVAEAMSSASRHALLIPPVRPGYSLLIYVRVTHSVVAYDKDVLTLGHLRETPACSHKTQFVAKMLGENIHARNSAHGSTVPVRKGNEMVVFRCGILFRNTSN